MTETDQPQTDQPQTDQPQVPRLAAGSPMPAEVFDVALLDLDGVVYVGSDAVPGVPATLAAARSAGLRLGFVTNNAARTPREVADHLTDLGVAAGPSDVITSSQAAATVVAERFGAGARVLPVGGPGVAEALRAAGLTVVHRAEDDPAAVVQGYGREVGWADLAEAVVAVRRGARHVATNTDATIPSPRGVLPGNGALVGVVSAVTGQVPLVTGKPDPAMHAECVRRTDAQRPIVVGDRLDTDIEGGRVAGVATLLVLSGVSDCPALLAAVPGQRPDLVSADTGGLLRCHPPVRPVADTAIPGGGWRCGTWTAVRHAGGVVELRSTGGGADGADPGDPGPGASACGGARQDDGLDGLRALCVAHWSGHPDDRAPAQLLAGDEPAAAALQRWGLSPR